MFPPDDYLLCLHQAADQSFLNEKFAFLPLHPDGQIYQNLFLKINYTSRNTFNQVILMKVPLKIPGQQPYGEASMQAHVHRQP